MFRRGQAINTVGGEITPGYEAMSHAAVCMHERESFGSIYASALMMTNLTMNNRRNQLIDRRQEKEGPAKGTAGIHLPVMPEKLICPLPHKRKSNINMLDSH